MSRGLRKLGVFAVVFMTAMVVLSTPAAATVTSLSTSNVQPDNIPTGISDADGVTVSPEATETGGSSPNSITFSVDSASDTQIVIPLDNLQAEGISFGRATVASATIADSGTSTDGSFGTATTASADTARVVNARNQIEIEFNSGTLPGTPGGGETYDLAISLNNIDTSNANATGGLTYNVQSAQGASFGNFPDAVDSDGVSQSFSLVSIENIDQDERYGSISAALSDANDDETIEVGAGTFSDDDITNGMNAEDVTLRSIEGADDTTIQSTGSDIVELEADDNGLTIDGFTLDANGQNVKAVDRTGVEASLSVQDSVITSSGDQTNNLVTTDDDAGTVIIDNSTFEADALTNQNGLELSDADSGLDLTVSDTNFTGFDGTGAVALDAPTGDLNAFTFENNGFDDNTRHIDGTSVGTYDLNTIFADNTFDQFVLIEDSNGDNINAIEGDDVGTAVAAVGSSQTVIVGPGDYGANSLTLDDAQSTLTSVNGPENTTISLDNDGNNILSVLTGTTGVTISGIEFDMDSDAAGDDLAIDGTPDTNLEDLTIDNNRFVNTGGDATYIDLEDAGDNDENLDGLEVTSNVFESSDDNDYTAVALGANEIAGPTNTDQSILISDNVINNSQGDGDNNPISVTQFSLTEGDLEITDNEFNAFDGGTAISVDANVDDVDASVDISNNVINGLAGSTAKGIDVDNTGTDTALTIDGNEISGLAASNSEAIEIDGTDGAAVDDNVLDNNYIQFDFDGSYTASNLVGDNTLETRVEALDNNGDRIDTEIFGLVAGGADEATNAGSQDTVEVFPGTYVEHADPVQFDSAQTTVTSTGEAAETVITTPEGEDVDLFDIQASDVVIDGFSFNSAGSGNDVQADSNTDGHEVLNSVFSGPGTDSRTAIDVPDTGELTIDGNTIVDYDTGIQIDEQDVTVNDTVIDTTTTGIDVQAGDTDTTLGNNTVSNSETGVNFAAAARLQDSDIENNELGLEVDDAGTEVVRNRIAGNDVGAEMTTAATVNFNDIVGNDIGLENDGVGGLALANFFGDETGPTLSDTSSENPDLLVDDTDDPSVTFQPSLVDSYETLPTDSYVIIPEDPGPPADTEARVLIAVLDDGLASNADTGNTRVSLLEDPGDDFSGINIDTDDPGNFDGSADAADPLLLEDGNDNNELIEPDVATKGNYTLLAFHQDGLVDSSPETVQTYTGTVDSVEVASDISELPADGETTANISLQLVDSEGDNVTTRKDVDFAVVGGAQAADASIDSEDSQTNVNGLAQATISADVAGETITVLGEQTADDNSGTVSIDTVEPAAANFTVEFVDGPTTITQNESYSATVNVINEGDSAGTQDITYNLEDSTGISQLSATEEDVQLNAGASEEVTFEIAASDTQSLNTDDGFAHVFESDDDTLTIENITVEEAGTESASVTFNDQSVQNGTEEVTVASANFTLADGTAGDYVVVVHVVSDEFDGGLDNSISAPVGASGNLSNGAENITVDLNSSAAFEDGDALDTLSENVTLRAMLHTTANDSAFGTRLGNAIDGIEPGDETDDADITVTPASPLDGPAAEFDADADGDISITELGAAGAAFAQGELTIAELGAVGQQFAS